MAFYATTFPEQRLETIRVLGRTMQCQVAHDVGTHRDAGVLPADAGSNCPCARSAARICRETFDQNDHPCLPRVHAGRGRVTWPPRRVRHSRYPYRRTLRVSRPVELHLRPLAEPDGVGIELGCASCRRRVTILALSVARWVHISVMTTSPEAPLQFRKVGFPDSGFRLGFPREAFPRCMKLKRSHAYTPTHVGLPSSSS